MQRWMGLSEIPTDLLPAAVTIGNFDGVHRGHRAVLGRLGDLAAERGLTRVAVTFDPHPLQVLAPERAPHLVMSLDQRLATLAAEPLDAVLVLPFTRELAAQTPEEFVAGTFVDALHARLVVVGRDARFGVRNSGDVGTLRELGEGYGFEVVVVDDEGETGPAETGRWSSSQVRELLEAGDVEAAARVLGRPHRVGGVVVHGDHRGRELGYPTANLCQDADGLVPADGVYAGWLVRSQGAEAAGNAAGVGEGPARHREDGCAGAGERLPAAISIGTNPTFDGTERRVEAYVLDRTDLDLYGEPVTLEFVARLRPTQRFSGVEELLEVMAQDVARARDILGSGR